MIGNAKQKQNSIIVWLNNALWFLSWLLNIRTENDTFFGKSYSRRGSIQGSFMHRREEILLKSLQGS